MNFFSLLFSSAVSMSAASSFANSDLDRRIEHEARASYNFRAVLAGSVEVRVSDRIVRLTGTVTDMDLGVIAEDTVSNLPGVLRVDNQITFDPSLQRDTDAWIARKIRDQLLVHAGVSNRNTTVVVSRGHVTLQGVAASDAERNLVGAYAAEVVGVKSVTNRILVVVDPDKANTPVEFIDDASITSQVIHVLSSHQSTSALDARVTTTDGVVVITGRTGDDAGRALVEKLAHSIRGVKSVTNEMIVRR